MKNLIFLFIGFFCFANAQTDSVRIVTQLNKLEQVSKETKVLLQKSEKIDRENRTLIQRIKNYIQSLVHHKDSQTEKEDLAMNSQAVEVRNINKPIVEVQIPDGIDSIRGSFFYRLFHKNKIILKPYKIINDEKVYLD